MKRTALGAAVVSLVLAACDPAEPPAAPVPHTPAPARAAMQPAVTAPTVQTPPALLARISPEKPSEPLALAKADIAVLIRGFLAETTSTLTFRNPHDRALEAELVFPLPEGATVSGYALDVGGELVDGVVVERHEARIAFEKEVRKGIDPGLVEWVKGNNFRTRVWPVPARGSRTIRVRYVSDLVTQPDGGALRALYALPLRFRQPIPDFSLEVQVVKGLARPEVHGGGIANFRFDEWEDRYVARTHGASPQPSEDLLIALPDVPRRNIVVERDAEGNSYFVIVDFPAAPPADGAAPKARRVGVFWDASLSRERADHEQELALLKAWAQRTGDVDVDVVVFRNPAEAPRAFAVRGGDAGPLVAYLESLAYDGGTRLGALRFTSGHDYDLLFSDGLGNLGEEAPSAEVPVYAVSTDSRANHALLGHLARGSGGEYLNLPRVGVAAAAEGIGVPGFSLLSAEYERAAIAELTPPAPRRIQGRLTLTGRLLANEAQITLRYGRGSVSQTRSYALRQADAGPGRLVPQFWAQQRVAELSALPERNHDELLRLGRRFGIVTPGTSLLVLETVAQYVEHRVEPPRSRGAIRAEYRRQIQQAQSAEGQKKRDKLEQVVVMWNRRVEWWEREFKYPEGLRMPETGVEGGVPGGIVGGVAGRVPAPPPPPALSAAPATAETVMVMAEAAAELKSGDAASALPEVVLKPWDPATPYLTALKKAGRAGAYASFLAQRKQYGESPAFYLDCADHFLRQGQRDLGVRVLTDVVELQLEEPRLLRIAAHRLQQIGERDMAVDLFEKVLRMRPEEPQSLRDLALALEARADARRQKAGKGSPTIAAEYLRAVELFNRVVLGDWDGRFAEIEVTALEEANRIMSLVERDAAFGRPAFPVDPRLRKLLDVDLRIVMTWDTDLTDMDLWVTEPSGEKCFYSHALTATGGMMSHDFTAGYGPEEYLVRRAMPGEYRIQSNFYGSRSQTLTGPTTVQATVITHFGRPNEARQALTLRLGEAREVVDVGTARFSRPQ